MRFTDVVSHGHRRAALALATLALPGLLLASAAAAAASPMAAATTAGAATQLAAVTQTGKPVPVQPPTSPGAGTGAAIPAKPHGLRAVRPLTAWTVSLTASSKGPSCLHAGPFRAWMARSPCSPTNSLVLP